MSNAFILPCPHCHTRNRVPADHIGQQATCGKCGLKFTTVKPTYDQPVSVDRRHIYPGSSGISASGAC